jgi:hypothetical protein
MRGENFLAHLDGLGGTAVYRGKPVAHHWSSETEKNRKKTLVRIVGSPGRILNTASAERYRCSVEVTLCSKVSDFICDETGLSMLSPEVFVIFISPPRKMQNHTFEISYHHLFSHSFYFTVYNHPHIPFHAE